MEIIETPLQGLLIIQPNVYSDDRGCFYEVYQHERYESLGIPAFVQDNFSHSKRNVIRGLHFQLPHPQGKLVFVTHGHIWDVVVDIRKSSSTFGQWYGLHLDATRHQQLYIPPGFAHGFCVLSDEANLHYKCTDYYYPEFESGIAWNDPGLKIEWPIERPILSSKDMHFLSLREYQDEKLFA